LTSTNSSQNSTVLISDVPSSEREKLIPILEESFEGWYLRHSKRTLFDIGLVREARVNDEPAGLIMLKDLGNKLGYVYYIAVSRKFRGTGIAGKLLDNSLSYFFDLGAHEVYASVEEGNEESTRLFLSRKFRRTSRSELAKKYGTINSFVLLRKMLIVPGEVILFRELSLKLNDLSESPSAQSAT
jgi:ribosomal protein S18 acetylase RimI-like enzyme